LELWQRGSKAKGKLEIDPVEAEQVQLMFSLYADGDPATNIAPLGIKSLRSWLNRDGPTARWRGHPFDRACNSHGIEHRLTKVKHPWTNGQVERMNRTIKEATVKRFHYDSHQQLERHLDDFVAA
jgi:transposase InsO family protein